MYYLVMVQAQSWSHSAHDERDYEFASKFNLPINEVIAGGDIQKKHTQVLVNILIQVN